MRCTVLQVGDGVFEVHYSETGGESKFLGRIEYRELDYAELVALVSAKFNMPADNISVYTQTEITETCEGWKPPPPTEMIMHDGRVVRSTLVNGRYEFVAACEVCGALDGALRRNKSILCDKCAGAVEKVTRNA